MKATSTYLEDDSTDSVRDNWLRDLEAQFNLSGPDSPRSYKPFFNDKPNHRQVLDEAVGKFTPAQSKAAHDDLINSLVNILKVKPAFVGPSQTQVSPHEQVAKMLGSGDADLHADLNALPQEVSDSIYQSAFRAALEVGEEFPEEPALAPKANTGPRTLAEKFSVQSPQTPPTGLSPEVERLYSWRKPPQQVKAEASVQEIIAAASMPTPQQAGRQMITGDTRRLYVPPIGSSAAFLERLKTEQIPAPRQRLIAPVAPKLPEIFKGMEDIGPAASRITGYDPSNPPTPHTITPQAFHALSDPLKDQYHDHYRANAARIATAKARYDQLVRAGQDTLLNEHVVKTRQDSADKESALTQFNTAQANLDLSEKEVEETEDELVDLKKKAAKAIQRNLIKLDPKTSQYLPKVNVDIPNQVASSSKLAETLNADLLSTNNRLTQAKNGLKKSTADFTDARNKATARKLPTPLRDKSSNKPVGKISSYNKATGVFTPK